VTIQPRTVGVRPHKCLLALAVVVALVSQTLVHAQNTSVNRTSVRAWLQARLGVSEGALKRAVALAERLRLKCSPIDSQHPDWTYGCEGKLTASTEFCRAVAVVVAVNVADERNWRQDANASLDCGNSTIELDLHAECSVWARVNQYPADSFTPLLSEDYVFDRNKGKLIKGDTNCVRIH